MVERKSTLSIWMGTHLAAHKGAVQSVAKTLASVPLWGNLQDIFAGSRFASHQTAGMQAFSQFC